jgi:benzoyl-CoA reductase/2-hydroxyglutaryl-CoA dehydratase subunit BcrC/BadD/HgdB
MHLLDGFAEEIVNIDDLIKIQDMEGLREETQKFTAKVKELIEALQKRIKEQNEKKIVALGVYYFLFRNSKPGYIKGRLMPRS